MPDAAARIEGPQRRRGHGGRITLDEHPVWPLVEQDWLESGQDRCRDLGRGLIVLHDVQVVVGLDPEDVQHLVEHVAVLGGHAHAAGDSIGMAGELANDRTELDGFGTGPEDGQHFERRRRHATKCRFSRELTVADLRVYTRRR